MYKLQEIEKQLASVEGKLGEIGRNTLENLDAILAPLEPSHPVRTPLPSLHLWKEAPVPRIIAEVKKASPSQGAIATAADPCKTAGSYLKAGATMLSVLTEEKWFGGHIEYLRQIRKSYPQAVLLMKDFIVHSKQLDLACWAGADYILLIVALLGPELTRQLQSDAKQRGLGVLMEVHDEREMNLALDLQPDLLGINNRNLKTLEVDLQTSCDLIPKLRLKSPETVVISESGLRTAADLKRLERLGADGFLIGTSLMSGEDPGKNLTELIRQYRVG